MDQSHVMRFIADKDGFEVRKDQEVNDDLVDAFSADFECLFGTGYCEDGDSLLELSR